MKNSQFKTNHSFLNQENVTILKDGDVVEYYFDTMCNGRKYEKVIFRKIEQTHTTGVKGPEKTKVEAIHVDYISPECFSDSTKKYITRDVETNWDLYCIYTNGWNPLRIVSVNDEKWEDVASKHGFTNFLSVQEQRDALCEEAFKEVIDEVEEANIAGKSFLAVKKVPAFLSKNVNEAAIGYNLAVLTVRRSGQRERDFNLNISDLDLLPQSGPCQCRVYKKEWLGFNHRVDKFNLPNNEILVPRVMVDCIRFYYAKPGEKEKQEYNILVNPNVKELESRLEGIWEQMPCEKVSDGMQFIYLYNYAN